MPMDRLPEQQSWYPYSPLGYDMQTMTKVFIGYGCDVVAVNGTRVTSIGQQMLAMNFLKIIQRNFGHWSVNEVATYCYVMNRTIFGDLVSIEDVAEEFRLSRDEASALLKKLKSREILQSYADTEDEGRTWLRLHPTLIKTTINSGVDIWFSQRRILEQVLQDDGWNTPDSDI